MSTYANVNYPSGAQKNQSTSLLSQTSSCTGSGPTRSRRSSPSNCSSSRRSGSCRYRSGSEGSCSASRCSPSGSARSCSGSCRSRSGSARSRSASRSSRSGSPCSRSASHSSRSGSERFRSGSCHSRSASACSRSRSGRSRSGSCRSRGGSVHSRNGSCRSRSGSARSCNRSYRSRSGSVRSHSGSRSYSGSIHSREFRSGSRSVSERSCSAFRHSRINSVQEVDINVARKHGIFSNSEDETQPACKRSKIIDTDKNGYDSDDDKENSNFISDFDAMLLRKKAEKVRRRKQDIDFINDNDDLIAQLILDMEMAAEQDRELNIDKKPATKKLSMLKQVMSQLIKKNLQLAFVEHNILSVLTDWLSPLPNKSLPCLQVRESILKLLEDFPKLDTNQLKQSGIGKAVMYLYKHPQETKANRVRAEKLIFEWARPVFNVSSDFKAMSKEERQERDLAQLARFRGKTPEPKSPTPSNQAQPSTGDKIVHPGDTGWVPRARVPMPSNTNYVIRPKSTVDRTKSTPKKPKPTRLEQCLKKFCKSKRDKQPKSIVNLSIEGRKMPL